MTEEKRITEKRITIEASNIDEAIEEASRQLNIPAENLRAQVISESREGFLGLFGNRKLTVEVRTIIDENEPDLISRGIEFVNQTLKLMDINAESSLSETEKNTLDIHGDDAEDYVVGRYGDCIKAMEYIVNLALRDPKNEPRLKIDSCGYRERRTKSLERLAEATARQAVKFGRPVRLDPMASWERWVIHNALKNRDDVMTESVGEPPTRKVVVMPKFDPDDVRAPGPATMRIRAQRERNERNSRNTSSNSRNGNSRGRFRR
ncbi:MAG: Jag N-terminal domain-containing protein [Synergistaceae bacterium]|nr:Jag N-terminal domain-containing protein [Synergistaceae bacterium]